MRSRRQGINQLELLEIDLSLSLSSPSLSLLTTSWAKAEADNNGLPDLTLAYHGKTETTELIEHTYSGLINLLTNPLNWLSKS